MLFSTVIMTACSYGDWFKVDLKAPRLYLSSTEKTIRWKSVDNAEKYEVYMNNELYEVVTATVDNNFCGFSDIISEEVKLYKFYVIAVADGFNSSLKSNVVSYVNQPEGLEVERESGVDNTFLTLLSNEVVSDNVYVWDEIVGANEYAVSLYTNELGQLYFETDVNAFDFNEYVDDDEVVLLRAGLKDSDGTYTLSNQIYYNTNSTQPTYNNNYFCIDGYVGDYYITDQYELNKIVYYGFINRVDTLNIYLSNNFMEELVDTFGTVGYNGTSLYHLSKAVEEACYSFVETCDYDTTIVETSPATPTKNDFGIKFTFGATGEPEHKKNKVRTQNELDTPYYDKVSYAKRSAEFENFASDKQARLETVTTSEQLYHAVESKATPIFVSDDEKKSTAEKLYNSAKVVLREIVSDEMTEYEKVLSIFDYICYNTVYDDEIVDHDDEQISFTAFTSFYLEGVFNDGLSVCDGFSKAFAMMCNMEGIDCVRITGRIYKNGAYKGLHAWNKVKIGDKWYVVDITWTVTKTNEGDFTTGGEAIDFNAKEFLSYKYFLVADSYIANTHYPTDEDFNESIPANDNYYYYANQTYDGYANFIVSSREEFIDLVNYMLDTEQYSFEVAFSGEYITLPIVNASNHDAETSSESKAVKSACGIADANILFIGYTCQRVSNTEYGTIYSITIINLGNV